MLVVGHECVCRPSDVAVGPDQHRAYLEVVDGPGHDVDPVRPATCGVTHMSAGQVEQYWACRVKQIGYPSPIVQDGVGHQTTGERMNVAPVVADVGAGE